MANVRLVMGALLALAAAASGCGGGGAGAANSPVRSVPRTVHGITFTQSAEKAIYRNGEPVTITFTVTNHTAGSATWQSSPMFEGAATDAIGQPTGFPSFPGGVGGGGPQERPSLTIAPRRSASATQTIIGLTPGVYTITADIPDALFGTAFGPLSTSAMPGGSQATQYANPITITMLWGPGA